MSIKLSSKHLAMSLVALAAAAVGAQAQAQTVPSSSVTIYGVVDAYGQYLKGNDSLARVQSGGLNGSRFGLRGSEDLGGGLRGIFTLESGINLDDGTNGQNAFWGRQAFVGIVSPYGTVTAGRQYGSLYALSGDFSEFTNGPAGASTAVIGGFGSYEPVRGGSTTATLNGGPSRVNNAVKYETPSFSGLKAGALVGLGEVSGNTRGTRQVDVYARYTQGPIDAMLSAVDDNSSANGLAVRTFSGAAAYSFGDARAMAGVISVNDRTRINADGTGYWVGGDYRIGLNLLRLQYVQNKAKNVAAGKTQAIGAGYQYDLSKRTALYSSLTYFKNEGAGYRDRIATAIPAGLTTASDRNVTEFVAGVRHAF